ncbi:MAG: peptidylprolyl isomerase [Candidatus Dasytiphilus stammeri]
MKKLIILIISINLITSIPSLAAIKMINKIAAIVNDEVILQSEIENCVNFIKPHYNEKLPFYNSYYLQIIENLIINQILYNLGKIKHLSVNQNQINLTIKNPVATKNMIRAQCYKPIITNDHNYRKTLSKELITKEVNSNIIRNSVNITPSEITSLINQIKNNNNDLSEFSLNHIIIPLSKYPTTQQESKAKLLATEIIHQINNYPNFDILNNINNIIIFKNQKVCWRQIKSHHKILFKNLINPNLIGPIKSQIGFHIFQINEINNKIIFITDIHIRHIFLKLSNWINDKQAIKIMKQIKIQIKNGKLDFARAAKFYSQDTISAPLGGDLGWESPNILGYKLSTVLLKLKTNEISLPVRSPMGWHLIQLLGARQVNKTNIIFQEQALKILYMRKFVEVIKLWVQEQQQLINTNYVKIFDKNE